MADRPTTQQFDPGSLEAHAAPKVVVELIPSVAHEISALASANVPFVFFDHAVLCGQTGGVGQITLTAGRQMKISPEGVVFNDHVVTGLLRAPLPSLRELRNAIDKVEQAILEYYARAGMPPAPDGTAH